MVSPSPLPHTGNQTDAECPWQLLTLVLFMSCRVDVRLWDIIAEIITLTLSPSPVNPFRINLSYYETLPLEECVIATGAMLDFLQRVYMKDTPYTEAGKFFSVCSYC